MMTHNYFSVLIAAGLVSVVFLRRAIPASLSRPEAFPSAPWGWLEALFSSGLAAFFIAMAAESAGHAEGKVTLQAVMASLALYGALVVLVIGFLVFRGINPVEAFGLHWRGWASGIFLTVPCGLLLALPLIYLAQNVAYLISGPETAPQAIVTFFLENSGWKDRSAVAAVAILAAPVTEELVFRGCIYGIVRKGAGRMAAVVATSVLFALIHGHVPSLPGLFILAVALSLVYERTGSLWAPMGLHAAFNGLTIVGAILFPDFSN